MTVVQTLARQDGFREKEALVALAPHGREVAAVLRCTDKASKSGCVSSECRAQSSGTAAHHLETREICIGLTSHVSMLSNYQPCVHR